MPLNELLADTTPSLTTKSPIGREADGLAAGLEDGEDGRRIFRVVQHVEGLRRVGDRRLAVIRLAVDQKRAGLAKKDLM